MSEIEGMKLPEPVAWMHIQGNHCEPSLRQLDEGEASRGWIESPLYAAKQVRQLIAAERERCAQIAERDEFYGSALQHQIAAVIRRG